MMKKCKLSGKNCEKWDEKLIFSDFFFHFIFRSTASSQQHRIRIRFCSVLRNHSPPPDADGWCSIMNLLCTRRTVSFASGPGGLISPTAAAGNILKRSCIYLMTQLPFPFSSEAHPSARDGSQKNRSNHNVCTPKAALIPHGHVVIRNRMDQRIKLMINRLLPESDKHWLPFSIHAGLGEWVGDCDLFGFAVIIPLSADIQRDQSIDTQPTTAAQHTECLHRMNTVAE